MSLVDAQSRLMFWPHNRMRFRPPSSLSASHPLINEIFAWPYLAALRNADSSTLRVDHAWSRACRFLLVGCEAIQRTASFITPDNSAPAAGTEGASIPS